MSTDFRALLLVTIFTSHLVLAADPPSNEPGGRQWLRAQTTELTSKSLADVQSIEDWDEQRDQRVRRLQYMLGLYPMPERTPLQTTVTGTLQRDGVIVEKLHFQSRPGLYVTGNLYRPEKIEGKLPAILYVCGHGRVKKDGVSYGNKTHYQHHGAWFAKHGYVCLLIDTIQLGEIEGKHHGTFRHGMWWWNNRGYTPAGVEAWNGMRAIDYLQSRDDVDADRIGITGRSGGGAYSWWIAALDQRIKVAVPVAGITSMMNHVVDDCIENHCDCMFMVNQHRWDFPELAALVAPRPLLISNTDNDPIFPLNGVVDVYFKTRRIYELHGKPGNIGLNIVEGPHKDTQRLRINAFDWLNRHLKNKQPLITTAAVPLFEVEELKVFKSLPDDERVTNVEEWFVPESGDALPTDSESFRRFEITKQISLVAGPFLNDGLLESPAFERSTLSMRFGLERQLFADPSTGTVIATFQKPKVTKPPQVVDIEIVDLNNRQDLSDALRYLHDNGSAISAGRRPGDKAEAEPEGEEDPDEEASVESLLDQIDREQRSAVPPPIKDAGVANWVNRFLSVLDEKDAPSPLVITSPRSFETFFGKVGQRERSHIQRRIALLGITFDQIQVMDIAESIKTLQEHYPDANTQISVSAPKSLSPHLLHASLKVGGIDSLTLHGLDTDYHGDFQLLNISRTLTMQQTVLLAASRVKRLTLVCSAEEKGAWEPVRKAAEKLGWGPERLVIQVRNKPRSD